MLLVSRLLNLPRRGLGPLSHVQVPILELEGLHLGVEAEPLELRRPRRALLRLGIVLLPRQVNNEVTQGHSDFSILAARLLGQQLQ